MNGWSALARFLRTDPRDVGCAQAIEMLHVYVNLVASGAQAEQRYPGLAAHLRHAGRVVRTSERCWPPWATPGTDRPRRLPPQAPGRDISAAIRKT